MGNIKDGKKALRSRIVGEGEEAPDQLLANPLNSFSEVEARLAVDE